MGFRDRIKELRRVRAADLRRNPKNWRLHSDEQADALRGVLDSVGFADAVLARELPDGNLELIDGHLRADIAPDEEVPVLVLDVDSDEADLILATYDPLAAMAKTDSEALAGLLKGLIDEGDTLTSLVWPDYIIDPLLSADWSPPDLESLDDHQRTEHHTAVFTVEQWEIVSKAIRKLQTINDDDTIKTGRALELICADFLAVPEESYK